MISDTNIYSAAKVLEGNILKTPQITSPLLSESLNCELFLKLECLQYTSSFKARGAYVAMETLDSAQKKKGVIAMSAGNPLKTGYV